MGNVEGAAQAIADALAPTQQSPSARWRWGTVASVQDDGTITATVGGTTVSGIRAAQQAMGAAAGDRVRICYLGTEAFADSLRASSKLIKLPSIEAPSFNGFRGRKSLTTTDDIDALFETGVYYIQGNGAGGTFPSGTTGAYNSLISVGGHPSSETADSWVGKQILISGSTLYVRSYAGSPRAWSAWAQLVSTSVAVGSPTITNATATTFQTRRMGNVVNLSVYQLKLSAALANGSSVSLGTGIIGANARPTNVVYLPLVANVAGFGSGVLMSVGTGGNVTVYNRSGASLGTGVNLMGNTSWVI